MTAGITYYVQIAQYHGYINATALENEPHVHPTGLEVSE